MANKFLDQDGLLYLWGKIKAKFVVQETGKGLSTNDYTTAEKTKLSGIESGATAVTESTVNGWGFTKNTGTYIKPSSGIPKTDLASDVQTSLGKADSALQTHQDISGKVDKVTGKGLSTNDYTTAEKTKLSGIESGAQVNVQSDWDATSGDAFIKNKPEIPSKTSELTNDAGFITAAEVPPGVLPSTTTPNMDGTAAVGTETAFARGDHVHPTDTSRVPTTRKVNGKALSADVTLSAADVGARASTWTPTASDVGAVPTSRTVNGKALSANVTLSASDVSAIPTSAKGAAGGVASLDSDGKVPSTQLPSYVDDIVEGYYYNNKFYKESSHTTEITGETGKIYVDLSTNLSYRYGGSSYVLITSADMTKITNAEIDAIVAT